MFEHVRQSIKICPLNDNDSMKSLKTPTEPVEKETIQKNLTKE